jgi:hypothetical protein
MEEFTVSTYSEYAAVTEQIYGDYTESEALIVFRGQTAEHRLPDGRLALIPSGLRRALRPGEPDGLKQALSSYFEAYLRTADTLTRTLFERHFGGSFETFVRNYLFTFNFNEPYQEVALTDLPAVWASCFDRRFATAIAQHYGAPTDMLDVTTDPDVALWFAMNRYCRRGPGYPIHYEAACDSGYVYVLSAPSELIVPLSTYLFDCNMRPRRQQAAALFPRYEDPSSDELRKPDFSLRWSAGTFAEVVIARIEIATAVSSAVAGWTTTRMFPGPSEDSLYAHLLKNCSWVENFVHCCASPEPSESSVVTPTFRARPVQSSRELASDPSWLTILLLGDDAPAVYEYAWKFLYAGNPVGVVNLFDKEGLNLIEVTVDEAKDMIADSGVVAILFCDVDGVLIRDGIADDLCQRIAQSEKVVNVHYLNVDEHWRRVSESPFTTDPVVSTSEGHKITRWIRSTIEVSWQLQRAAPSSLCRRQFSDNLRVLFR